MLSSGRLCVHHMAKPTNARVLHKARLVDTWICPQRLKQRGTQHRSAFSGLPPFLDSLPEGREQAQWPRSSGPSRSRSCQRYSVHINKLIAGPITSFPLFADFGTQVLNRRGQTAQGCAWYLLVAAKVPMPVLQRRRCLFAD